MMVLEVDVVMVQRGSSTGGCRVVAVRWFSTPESQWWPMLQSVWLFVLRFNN